MVHLQHHLQVHWYEHLPLHQIVRMTTIYIQYAEQLLIYHLTVSDPSALALLFHLAIPFLSQYGLRTLTLSLKLLPTHLDAARGLDCNLYLVVESEQKDRSLVYWRCMATSNTPSWQHTVFFVLLDTSKSDGFKKFLESSFSKNQNNEVNPY